MTDESSANAGWPSVDEIYEVMAKGGELIFAIEPTEHPLLVTAGLAGKVSVDCSATYALRGEAPRTPGRVCVKVQITVGP